MIQEKHVSFYVEKAKRNRAMTERLKFKGHFGAFYYSGN
jgi:hypothetical protein